MKYKRVIQIVLSIVLILLLFINVGECIFSFLLGTFFNREIKDLVITQTLHSTNTDEKIQNLSQWFSVNIKYASVNDTLFNIFRLYSFCENRPEITFFIKEGRCGEWATLYSEMLNYSNITNRVVIFVEDHAIVEASINGTLIPVEPPSGISSFEHYKNSENVSKAFSIDANGKKIDLTSYYAQIGFLSVKVDERDHYVPNSKVCVYSKYLMLSTPLTYKTHQLAFCANTNDFGIHTEEIGKGIYDVEAYRFSSPFECSYSEVQNYTVIPNNANNMNLNLKKDSIFSCFIKFLTIHLNQ